MSHINHTRYVVATSSGGFLGTRRFSHKEGTTHAKQTGIEYARIFTRRSDAARSCDTGDVVKDVTISLPAPERDRKI